MGAALDRADILFQRGRLDLAEREVARALAEEPESAYAHTLMGVIQWRADRDKEAERSLREAVRLAPDDPQPMRVLGLMYVSQGRLAEAKALAASVMEADPLEPHNHLLNARVLALGGQGEEALGAVHCGLALNPDDEELLKFKTHLHTVMGQRDQAASSAARAVTRNPESADAHAMKGLTLMHAGQVREAHSHFIEALRLEPGHGMASQGLVETIKARNPVYRVMLAVFLWMGRLGGRTLMFLIVGAFLLAQVMRQVGNTNPAVAAWVTPVLVIYGLFVMMTWVSQPLFDLMLRLHPVGWHALGSRRRRASTAFGLLLLPVIPLLVVWAVTGSDLGWIGGLYFALIAIAVASTLNQNDPRQRRIMAIAAMIFLVSYPAAIFVDAVAGPASILMVGSILVFSFAPMMALRRGWG